MVIVSKKAIERLGFADSGDAVNSKVKTWVRGRAIMLDIIGVIDDYQIMPLLSRIHEDQGYNGMPGLALTFRNAVDTEVMTNKMSFRVDSENLKETIKNIEKEYKIAFPGTIFRYSFLDDTITAQYAQYSIALRQVTAFAILAMGIACLGLLGMMRHKLVQKTKEIGIRKVLGAAMHEIAFLLLNTTIRQIMIAILIGLPLAFYLTQRYLEEFSEQVVLPWWHYGTPIVILMIIMFATIASVLLKAARSNPVEALKYE